MAPRITQGDLYKGVKQGLSGHGGAARSGALNKLGIKKQGQGLRKDKHVGIMKTKVGANKYMRRAGLNRLERRAIMKTMFGSGKAANIKTTGTDKFANNTPGNAPASGKKVGLFSRGDSASRARAQISRQFGTRPGGPGFTSDRSSSTGSSAGGSSGRTRPAGPLF
ncbi:hypothetical protein KJ903_03015 [Patescibacteria group bacterium]|nr:hypothetical protein [Patescibacteria group bacterium]